jgi:signal transduction histidine kinase
MLKRRSIDIILSSTILPDGPLAKLHEVLELMTPPPELVVLSELGTTRSEMDSHPGYRFVELRRFNQLSQSQGDAPTEDIRILGADIRNDLNNPLQEIVAMAFVAQASQGLSPAADQALAAIERAAGNMASVVEGIEDKIRTLVQRSAA